MHLDDAQVALLRSYGGQTLTVGFRPEHLSAKALDGPGLTVTASVDVIEFLGNDELIHARSKDRDLVAIVNAENGLAVGDKVVLSAPPRSLYLFDPQSGSRCGHLPDRPALNQPGRAAAARRAASCTPVTPTSTRQSHSTTATLPARQTRHSTASHGPQR